MQERNGVCSPKVFFFSLSFRPHSHNVSTALSKLFYSSGKIGLTALAEMKIWSELSSSLLPAPAVIMMFVMLGLNWATTTMLHVHTYSSIWSRTKSSGLSSVLKKQAPDFSGSLLMRCHSWNTSMSLTLGQTGLALELVGEELIMRREVQVCSCFLPELSVRGLVISAFYCQLALSCLSPVHCLII